MHRALLVSEILREVFMHVNNVLDPHPSYPETLMRKSFAALARTCKPFYEPAMDLLWAKLYGIEPLLSCVTRLYPLIYNRDGDSKYFRFDGIEPLSEHEVPQFLHHAFRVRSLIIFQDGFFYLLSVLPIETCVFPRLLSLSTYADLNRYLHLFLSPTLRHCALPAVHPDLKSVPILCAALKDLDIKSLKNTAADMQVLYDSIRLCNRLASLTCPLLDWTTWEYLSNLPTLLTLEIWDVCHSLRLRNLKLAPFLNVTKLRFRIGRAAYTIAVMQHLEFPSLNQFEMEVSDLPWADTKPLFHVLSQHKTLSHITISSRRGYRELQDLLDSSSMPIRQLFCLTQLRTLRFKFPCCSIDLDDDLLLEVMSSWPHIRMLEFIDPRAVPTVTFNGLFTALHRCPRLHTLNIPLDAVDIDTDPTAEPFLHTSLQNLNLTSSALSDAEAVAHIIFSVLPSVDRIFPAGDEPSGVYLEVQKHLESLRASAVLSPHIPT